MTKTDELATASASRATGGPRTGSRARAFFRRPSVQQSWTALVFVVLFAGLGLWLGVPFLTASSRMLDMHQASPIILLGMAAVVTLAAGHFDLSITGTATLSLYMTIGLTVKQELPLEVALLVAVGCGIVGGFINGILIETLKIHAFIATLATGSVFTGIAAIYSGGQQISPAQDTGQLPEWFSGITSLSSFTSKVPFPVVLIALALALVWLYIQATRFTPARLTTARWRVIVAVAFVVVIAVLVLAGINDLLVNMSMLTFFVLITAAVLWVVMRYTTFGRHVKAVGANPLASELAGVSPRRIGISVYVISGFLASLAGIVMAASIGSAAVEGAASYLLPAFSAAFLSTVIFSPGQFTIWGAVLGAVLVVWITQALSIGGLVFTWAAVVNGVILLVAVAVSSIARRR